MNSIRFNRFQLYLALACMAAANIRADWEAEPNQIGAYVDLGQMVKGSYYTAGTTDNVEGVPLSRTGVYMTYAGISNKKLEVRITAGGLFWNSFSNGGEISDRIIQFGPGVGEAQGIYSFGDPTNPSAKLQLGLFPYKYNPDATNLGEYLYRSDAYPNTIWTGGWSYLNSADYLAEGAHFNLPTFGGKVVHDFTLFIERGIEPTDDLSPGYTLTVKPTSFLEFGGGLEWAHAFSFNSGNVTPNNLSNAYSTITNTPYGVALSNVGGAVANLDPTSVAYPFVRANDSLNWVRDSLTLVTPASQLGYYTFRAVKAMARISLDFGTLLNMPEIIPADNFKIYAEWALLGVKNYPYYYKDPWQRMPLMVGMHIPTFKLLDKLSCEVEYYKSNWQDNIDAVYNGELPLPSTPTNLNGPTTNWRWSIYASRHIINGLNVYAQAASDHQRQLYAGPGGADLSTVSSTPYTRDWYYVIRLEYGFF